jgi:hypothetical protein
VHVVELEVTDLDVAVPSLRFVAPIHNQALAEACGNPPTAEGRGHTIEIGWSRRAIPVVRLVSQFGTSGRTFTPGRSTHDRAESRREVH